MVFHTSPADIPPSPKEPPPPSEGEPVSEELHFGEPPDHIKVRPPLSYLVSSFQVRLCLTAAHYRPGKNVITQPSSRIQRLLRNQVLLTARIFQTYSKLFKMCLNSNRRSRRSCQPSHPNLRRPCLASSGRSTCSGSNRRSPSCPRYPRFQRLSLQPCKALIFSRSLPS